ncbi:hypothetical protein GF380_06245 [Candidatus Uhrbacteria bacterium]|nr:hypothetical protein [Candidatus Uhrbacteria bacterium]MBD3284655.1 hypothetical protein [Candidatus Uhrbacteria bacterium]
MKQQLVIRALITVAAFFIALALIPVGASGVTVTVSDGSGTTDAGSGGSTEITTSFTSSGLYVTGTQMTLTVSPASTSTLTDCSTASTDFGGSAGSFGSFTTSTAVFTLTENVATSTSGSLCLTYGLTTTTATNYSISVLATSSTSEYTATDFGAALYYVLGGNEVTVSAQVPASLSFSIRNSADTANTNVCALGTLSLSQVNFCDYRLRIATNAANGFTTTLQPDAIFNAGGSATMTAITNDTAFATGTEAYGIAFLVGATSGGRSGVGAFDQPVTEAGSSVDASLTFDADSTPLDFTTATTVISYTAPFNAASAPSLITTSRVMHGAAIGAGTPTGDYSHTITYRVTGSF